MADLSQLDYSLLHDAIDQGIISLDDVQVRMKERVRIRILSNHPHSIWQSKDGRWRSYLPDETKKNKRRMIVKATEEALGDCIVDYYMSDAPNISSGGYTLLDLYPEWMEFKKLHTTASTYVSRIDCDWRKYYVGTEIVNRSLIDITKLDMDRWVHELIKEYDMTKMQYYNATMIMRQVLDYAVDLEILTKNPLRLVKVDGKRVFRKVRKKPDEQEVFTREELDAIQALARKDMERNPMHMHKLAPLAILFQMQTGVRVGELSALRYSDVEHEDYIHVQRMLRVKKDVVDHTKTDYGDRLVFLTVDAKKIIEEARAWQAEHGSPTDGYIFSVNSDALGKQSVNALYRKYCRLAGILQRNSHKTRKTYISALIDGKVNINTIREMVGHADERTTLNCYAFDRLPSEERKKVIEAALR